MNAWNLVHWSQFFTLNVPLLYFLFFLFWASSIEDLTDFNLRQEKLNPNSPGAGHIFVKMKGDATKGQTQSGKDWWGN